jgi:hypothetical protein
MIPEIVNAIVARLQTAFPDLEVAPWPEKVEKFRLTHPQGALLVAYRGGKYSKPLTTDAIVQTRRMEFVITIQARSLRSNLGAYQMLEGTAAALTRFDACGVKLYPVDEAFVDFENTVWVYAMHFAGDAPAIAGCSRELDEINAAPTATQATFQGDGETLVIGG